MSKKTFTVIGNCQAPFLAQALLSNPAFAAAYDWHRTPPVHVLSREQISAQFEGLAALDLIIYQPVVNAERFGEFETGNLRAELGARSDLLCIPSCYFNGYFPTLSTIRGVQTPAQLVSDMAVFHSFDLGIPAPQAAHLLYETDYLPAEYYRKKWTCGLNELKAREAEFGVEVGLADYLEAEGRNTILMHQFNHPTQAVFNHLGDAICARLGLDGHCATTQDLDPICFPVLPALRAALDIPAGGHDQLRVNGTTVDLPRFVEGSYAAYEKMPAEQRRLCANRLPDLRAHIAPHAPVA